MKMFWFRLRAAWLAFKNPSWVADGEFLQRQTEALGARHDIAVLDTQHIAGYGHVALIRVIPWAVQQQLRQIVGIV